MGEFHTCLEIILMGLTDELTVKCEHPTVRQRFVCRCFFLWNIGMWAKGTEKKNKDWLLDFTLINSTRLALAFLMLTARIPHWNRGSVCSSHPWSLLFSCLSSTLTSVMPKLGLNLSSHFSYLCSGYLAWLPWWHTNACLDTTVALWSYFLWTSSTNLQFLSLVDLSWDYLSLHHS